MSGAVAKVEFGAKFAAAAASGNSLKDDAKFLIFEFFPASRIFEFIISNAS